MERKIETVVMSFINLKGGVAKTSTSINIADELSKDYTVLVIDMDPQFNATQSLLNHQLAHHKSSIPTSIMNSVEEEFNSEFLDSDKKDEIIQEIKDEKFIIQSQMIYQKLKDEKRTAKTLFTNDSLVSSLSEPNLIYPLKPNLSLIAGDLDLFETLNGDTAGKHNILHDHIQKYKLREEYDYIIIDCPPNWTILTQASLFASDYYVIPSKIDLFSSIGINLLENLVDSTFYKKSSNLYSTYNMFREKINKKNLKPLGILFTLTHELVISERVKKNLKSEIKSLNFFDVEIPYHPSVPLKFSMYSEIGEKHRSLTNALQKTVEEIQTKIKDDKEEELDDKNIQ